MTTVAVVGLGVGAQHAAGFVRAGCDLKWVHDLDPARSHALVAQLGKGAVAPSFEAILEDPSIDAVALATYDDDHADQVVRALGAGKHVFCEKPLCTNKADLDRMAEAWRKSDRHLASNLILRTAPLYRRVRDLIASGSLGEIYAFHGDYLYGRLPKITEGWRAEIDGYSVMLGGGVHIVDLFFWLTGQHATQVRSSGNRIASAGTKFRYHDFVTSTFTCPSGLVGVVTANFGCVHRHQHVVRIFGTKGTFLYDDMGARLYRERDPGGPAEVLADSPLPASKGDLIVDFLDGMRDRKLGKQRTTLDFSVIRACLAADDALLNETPSPIEPT